MDTSSSEFVQMEKLPIGEHGVLFSHILTHSVGLAIVLKIV